ncbi:MAG TPA: histidine ammonia-lyase [Gemmatimonadaceae bacterium]|nr:histidine ammonia-lyase [Gemmatimonadaceae bacterium]
MMTGLTWELDGRSLTRDVLEAVADGRCRVTLHAEAEARMERTRRVVEAAVASGAPVYGVNTGFGKLSEVAIARDDLAALQRNLVRSHAAGIGEPLPVREVRAMMLLRANVLATGYAGARPVLVQLLLDMLAAGVTPVVPERGSVGASGDLAPLAHLALVLIGEGRARFGSADGTGAEMLARAGLAPVTLEAKEGLALINGTQAHTAVAALATAEIGRLWRQAHVIGALTLDTLLGTPDAFDARIHAARGQRGQETSAALLRALLADSALRESHRSGDPRVQDAYALRCMPQVFGPVLDAWEFAAGLVARELNAATDNPLVMETGELISGGNFHGQAVGLASDVLAIGCANLAVMSERRSDRLVHPELSHHLPPFLAANAGLESGLMMAQVTAAALTSDLKRLAAPSSVDSVPTSGNKEDVVPMAMNAALKLRQAVHALRHVLAVELLCAADALDFRRPLATSPALESVHARVRALVPPRAGDRPPAPDIARLAEALAAGTFDVDLLPEVAR